MPPKCLKFQLPILLKGDRVKVHFRNLTTSTDNVWQGTCMNVDPNPDGTVMVAFPNDMPGFPDGIPIPSAAAGIKTTKVVVVKSSKSKEDIKDYKVPLPEAASVPAGAPVYVRNPTTSEFNQIPESDAARIRTGYSNWLSVEGAPVEEIFDVGWVQVIVNYKTMFVVGAKQHVKINQ
jgi:hypothetical protein